MTATRVARGDWQTPPALAREVIGRLAVRPRSIVEPTCGEGAFLVAAHTRFPSAQLAGWDIEPTYVTAARRALGRSAHISKGDFFRIDWKVALAEFPDPLLVVGNPPWVTNAGLGVLGADNLPVKKNERRLSGMAARTGKSNFDISEWMIERLLEALVGRRATLAVLCKMAVARKVIETIARRRLRIGPGGLYAIDAHAHFAAATSAALFVASAAHPPAPWPTYASLTAATPLSTLAVIDGTLVANAGAFAATRHLAGDSRPEWRSGLKHDCARVMELTRDDRGAWRNGLGDAVEVESSVLHPLLKSSDVAHDRRPARAVIVPQRALGEDTIGLKNTAPRAFRYLSRHRALLDARKSSIYVGQPPFAIFGVGPYAFAPWKVAISGLYKRLSFVVVGPLDGQPVMLDDTCYFLAFTSERAARRAAKALGSPLARDFLEARVFWDAKRPITKGILQTLDLQALETAIG